MKPDIVSQRTRADPFWSDLCLVAPRSTHRWRSMPLSGKATLGPCSLVRQVTRSVPLSVARVRDDWRGRNRASGCERGQGSGQSERNGCVSLEETARRC